MNDKKRYKTVGTKKNLLLYDKSEKLIYKISLIYQDYAKVKLICNELELFGTVILTVNNLFEFERFMQLWETEIGRKFTIERYMQPNFFKISRKK